MLSASGDDHGGVYDLYKHIKSSFTRDQFQSQRACEDACKDCLKNLAESKEEYHTFSLRTFDHRFGGTRISESIANIIVNFLLEESRNGRRRWKTLEIVRCRLHETLCRALESINSLALFSSCRFSPNRLNEGSEEFFDFFCRNNGTLQHLGWFGDSLSTSACAVLNEILKDPLSNIKRLTLQTSWHHPVDDQMIDMLRGSRTLQKLRLGRRIEDTISHRVLNLLESCPVLEEIAVSFQANRPFWINGNYNRVHVDDRRRLLRLNLLEGELHTETNDDDTENSTMILEHDTEFQQLLKKFPALGDVGHPKSSRGVPVLFSLRTTQLLAFNYAARDRLNIDYTVPPPFLWKRVLDRVLAGVCRGCVFLQRNDESSTLDLTNALALSCQASVLFSLLKHDPTLVTLESCEFKEGYPTSLYSSIAST